MRWLRRNLAIPSGSSGTYEYFGLECLEMNREILAGEGRWKSCCQRCETEPVAPWVGPCSAATAGTNVVRSLCESTSMR